jgi:cell wall-associated NlpC family hydrolase
MMQKLKTMLVLLCSFTLLSGCSPMKIQSNPSTKKDLINVDEQVSDTRMSNLAVIDHDPELFIGDLGVEALLSPFYRHRSNFIPPKQGFDQSFKMATLLAPNGFPLVEGFPDEAIVPLRGSYVENVIETAKTYMGIPYEYGSDRTEPSTFDCSDFTRWVYLYALGVDMPWDSRSQAAYVEAFSKRKYTDLNKARRGDLLFFTRYLGNKPSDYEGLKPAEKPITHMGIYMGNNKIIHSASKETGGVRIDQIRWKHLEYRFLFGAGVVK